MALSQVGNGLLGNHPSAITVFGAGDGAVLVALAGFSTRISGISTGGGAS
ncbi:hypothetical protein [Candidatus Chlamydia corallus]|nr:hypothetical protein [Candidatus Chlamydia corallus]